MNTEREKIVSMLNSLHFPTGKQSEEYTFTLEAVDIFYYKKNIGAEDIRLGFVDGPNDGGIDFIYSDEETLYLIQGKSSDSISTEDAVNAFNKIAHTFSKFTDRKIDELNDATQTALANAYEDLTEDKNVALVLFTNTVFNKEAREKINERLTKELLNSFDIFVYDRHDIELQRAVEEENAALVKEGHLTILLGDSAEASKLYFGDDKQGVIVNILASSLKNLYQQYKQKGLFSYNLREHIGQKNVDDAIDDTIKKEKDNFWYYNNGITIGCLDYHISGKKLKLYDFSIINGAQTTTKIGKSPLVNEKYDFALTCKVVRAEKSENKSGTFDEEDDNFIGKISEASNSQKPIKSRDLKSNFKEQRRMQYKSRENGKHSLAIEIKRGVRPTNYNRVEKWQRVTNDYIGQLIYACIFQRPGSARSSKNTMFSSKATYSKIFRREHDYDTLYDLVRLGDVYDRYVKELAEKADNDEAVEQLAMAKNAKLSVLGILCYLLKKKRGLIQDRNSDEVYKDNLGGLLVSDYPDDDLEELLHNCYEFVIRQLTLIYKAYESKMKLTSYSNFLKSDQYYSDIILLGIDNLDTYDQGKISTFMEVFTKKQNSYGAD